MGFHAANIGLYRSGRHKFPRPAYGFCYGPLITWFHFYGNSTLSRTLASLRGLRMRLYVAVWHIHVPLARKVMYKRQNYQKCSVLYFASQ